jgi:hypothetical protein
LAWIESHQTLRDHPKTLKLARLLRVNRAAVIGHLQCLWWWAMDYAHDGDLSRHDELDIAIGADWEGCPSALIDALVTVGFLDRDVDGTLVIHDWHDYAGKLIERRKANAERMRKARAASNQPASAAHDEDVSARAAHVQGTQRARVERPYRTEPDHTEPNHGGGDARERETAADAAPAPQAEPRNPQRKPASTPIPDDFPVTKAMRGWALQYTPFSELEIERETEKFRLYWQGEGKRKADWFATWRKWMREEGEKRERGDTRQRARSPDPGHVPRPPDDMTEEEQRRFYLRDVLERTGS